MWNLRKGQREWDNQWQVLIKVLLSIVFLHRSLRLCTQVWWIGCSLVLGIPNCCKRMMLLSRYRLIRQEGGSQNIKPIISTWTSCWTSPNQSPSTSTVVKAETFMKCKKCIKENVLEETQNTFTHTVKSIWPYQWIRIQQGTRCWKRRRGHEWWWRHKLDFKQFLKEIS